MTMRLVLASNNAKKLVELQALLAPAGVQLVPQPMLGLPEAEEPHATFVENALAKARHAARLAGGATIADDSGLCVDALGGAPGVASAHFATPDDATPFAPVPAHEPTEDREARRRRQDAANNRLLLGRLHGAADRRARFVCTLVALRSADDPEPLISTGRWDGRILDVAAGDGGFGYDPLLWIEPLGQSVAELAAEVKNAHSHRAIAAQAMLQAMREAWRLG